MHTEQGALIGYREARRKNEDSSTSIIQNHLQEKKKTLQL